MNSIQFVEAVKTAFLKEFPNGWIQSSSYALDGGIHFNAGLEPNLGHMNDVLRMSFGILDNIKYKTETEIEGTLSVGFIVSSLSIQPPNVYYAMGTAKIQSRRITNTPDKVVEGLVKYFAKARAVVNTERDANNIYRQDKIDPKYLA